MAVVKITHKALTLPQRFSYINTDGGQTNLLLEIAGKGVINRGQVVTAILVAVAKVSKVGFPLDRRITIDAGPKLEKLCRIKFVLQNGILESTIWFGYKYPINDKAGLRRSLTKFINYDQ